jgi:hypothetical protein
MFLFIVLIHVKDLNLKLLGEIPKIVSISDEYKPQTKFVHKFD